MSAVQFTAGPWRYEDGESGLLHTVTSDRGDIVYVTLRGNPEANAHLIAAAPELYEVAEQALWYLRQQERASPQLVANLQGAIAKARGEQVSA